MNVARFVFYALIAINGLLFLSENLVTPTLLGQPLLILVPLCCALLIYMAAYQAGILLLKIIGNEKGIPFPHRFFIQLALGMQVLILLLLALGACQLLKPWILKSLLVALFASLLWSKDVWLEWRELFRKTKNDEKEPVKHSILVPEDLHWGTGDSQSTHAALPWTLTEKIALGMAFCLGALLLLTANSPFSWYDSLVYHMAVPKMYWAEQKIMFLPDNVYSQFPLSAEMLNTACLLLDSELACKYLIFFQIFLTATLASVFLWTHTKSRSWALLSALWIASLGLNYAQLIQGDIDTYLMFSSFVFLTHLIQCPFQKNSDFVLSGVLAGITLGFKYLAIPFVVFPGFLFLLFRLKTPSLLNAKRLCFWMVAALLTFSPWLLKNIVFTGNPVFPFLSSFFTLAHWSPEQLAVFSNVHGAKPGSALAVVYAFFTQMDGVLFLSLLFWLRVHRSFWNLLGLCALPVLGWLFLSQGNLRYLLPIYPLWLVGSFLLFDQGALPWKRKALYAFILGWVLIRCLGLWILNMENLPYQLNLKSQVQQLEKHSNPHFRVMAHLNTVLPADAEVLMLDEARTYLADFRVHTSTLFDKNPLENLLASSQTLTELLLKLKAQRFTHVLVNQAERERLQNAYGRYFPCEAGFYFKRDSKESVLFTELLSYVFLNNLLNGEDSKWMGICRIP